MRIDKCICTDMTFEQLIAEAREHGLSVDELGDCYGAGAGCGLCRAYLKRGIITGETVFHQILVEDEDFDQKKAAG